MKKNIYILLLVVFLGFVLTTCKKDVEKDILVITPQMLNAWVGKDWNTIAPTLENKKDYLYTTLNGNSNTLAAISLPAIDPNAPARNYKILFNLYPSKQIRSIRLECTDTLNIKKGNELFLYYYRNSYSLLNDLHFQRATYNYAQNPDISVENLVDRLSLFSCEQPTLDYRNDQMHVLGMYSENAGLFSSNYFTYL